MSLINKMLQDLEARQDATPSTPAKPVYQGLRPVQPSHHGGPRRLALVLAGIAAVAAALYFGAESLFFQRELTSPQVATPIPKTKAADPVAAQAVSAPAPAPAATVLPSATPAQAPERAVPAPATAASPAGTTGSNAGSGASGADEKPTVVASNKHPQSSPATTVPGIVKPAPSPPVAAPPVPKRPADTKAPQAKPQPIPAKAEESTVLVDKKLRPLTADETAEAGYRRGVMLLEQGRSDEALRQLRDAIAAQPKHIKARELAAGIELQNGHWREAQRLLEDGLRQVSNQYLFARMLARVYLDHGAEAKALAVMEGAAPQGSDDADFSALLGLLYQRAGRHGEAVKTYERAATLRPNDGRIWLGFAISLEGTEQLSAAKNAYRRAQQNELVSSLARYAEERLAALEGR